MTGDASSAAEVLALTWSPTPERHFADPQAARSLCDAVAVVERLRGKYLRFARAEVAAWRGQRWCGRCIARVAQPLLVP